MKTYVLLCAVALTGSTSVVAETKTGEQPMSNISHEAVSNQEVWKQPQVGHQEHKNCPCGLRHSG